MGSLDDHFPQEMTRENEQQGNRVVEQQPVYSWQVGWLMQKKQNGTIVYLPALILFYGASGHHIAIPLPPFLLHPSGLNSRTGRSTTAARLR